MSDTLIMPFIDESKSFTEGFECGMIWGLIKSGECLDNHPIHNVNVEQVKMICETFGADYSITGFCDGWSSLSVYETRVEN